MTVDQETKGRSDSRTKPAKARCNLYVCERENPCTRPGCECVCHEPGVEAAHFDGETPKPVPAMTRTETVGGLTREFYRLVLKNPNATDTPGHWETLWTPDITNLVKRYGYRDAQRIVHASQSERFAKYVVRGEGLLKMSGEIASKLKIKPFNGIYPETDYGEVAAAMDGNIDDI